MQLPDPVAHYRAVFGSILKKTFSIWAQKVTFKLNFGGGFGSFGTSGMSDYTSEFNGFKSAGGMPGINLTSNSMI